jgi:hypothetical protein
MDHIWDFGINWFWINQPTVVCRICFHQVGVLQVYDSIELDGIIGHLSLFLHNLFHRYVSKLHWAQTHLGHCPDCCPGLFLC